MNSEPGDEKEKGERIDPALAKKALENLRNLLKGNGAKPESLTLKHFDGEILDFEAYALFKIEPAVSEKHVPGREHGETAGSYPDAQQKIKAALEKISRDREIRNAAVEMLKSRPDIGFAVKDLTFPLDRMNKKFVLHEPCGPCDTTGKILCRNCQGKRQIACPACHGQRQVICPACHGTHFISGPKGRQQCSRCHGRGRVTCKMCEQTGHVHCPKCKATGKMPCQNCASTGWNSRIFLVSVKAKGNFAYNHDGLPPEIPPLIDEYGPDLVLEDYAQVRIIDDPRKDEELNRVSKHNEFIVPYHVRLPWGDIGFALGKTDITAKLFGFFPALLNLPPILEKTMGAGLQALSHAAKAQGNVAENVGKAIRYRAIGETFLASIPNPPQRAAALMRKRYPFALGDETIRRMVVETSAAIRHLTLKPRLQGLGIGGAAAAALFALYFLGPLRGALLSGGAGIPQLVPDMGAVIIGGAIVTAAIQLTATAALKNALGKLLEKSGGNSKLKPKAAQSALWGYPAALLLFALILQLAVMQGAASPDWYRHIIPGAAQGSSPR